MTHDEAKVLIQRQFDEGRLPPSQAEALRVHLRNNADSRAFYDEHVRLERAMDGGRAQAERFVARGWSLPADAPKRTRRWPWIAGLAAAAALAVFVLRPHPPTADLRVRGGGSAVAAGVVVLRMQSADVTPQRTDGVIRSTDGLIFSYTNPTAAPFTHLLVMGRDARGAVRWYHPQWLEATQSPSSVAIRPGADVPLPTAIWHRYPPGPLEICAVFSKAPIAVPPLDARLEGGAWPPEGGRCQTLQVTP